MSLKDIFYKFSKSYREDKKLAKTRRGEGYAPEAEVIAHFEGNLYIAMIVPKKFTDGPYFKILEFSEEPEDLGLYYEGGTIHKQYALSVDSPRYLSGFNGNPKLNKLQYEKLIHTLNKNRGIGMTNWDWILDTYRIDRKTPIPDYTTLAEE